MSVAPGERRRPIGDSGVAIDRLVLGCAPIGNLFAEVSALEAQAALEQAWRLGVRSFDTAPHYGAGLSEERLGRFLRGVERDQAVVSTKVGRLLFEVGPDVELDEEGFVNAGRRRRVRDYSADGVRASLESSLERLGLDSVDIALVHDPDDHADEALGESIPALAALKRDGRVGAIGVGMNQVGLLERFVETGAIDCVLIAGRYSLLDDSAARRLLPLCEQRGVAVIVGGVFNSGILANPHPGATFDYAPAPPGVLARVTEIRAVCERYGVALPAAALHYALAHPAVTSIVVGARSPSEIEENATHLATAVPDELFGELVATGLIASFARR